MNKAEFIDSLAKKTGSSKAAAAKSLDAIFELITTTLKKGGKNPFIGFGTFSVVKRGARREKVPRQAKR